MLKCFCCTRSISHITIQETRRGWGMIRFKHRRWREAVTILHCPNHGRQFIDLLNSLHRAPNATAARRIVRRITNNATPIRTSTTKHPVSS